MKYIRHFLSKSVIVILIAFLQLAVFASSALPIHADDEGITPQFHCLAADCTNKPHHNASAIDSPAPSLIATAQPCDTSSLQYSRAHPNQNRSDRGGFLVAFFQLFFALINLLLGGTDGVTPCSPTPLAVSPMPAVSAAPEPPTTSGTKTEKTSNWAGYAIQSPPKTNGYLTTNWNVTKMDCSAGKGHASSWPGMGGRANDPNIAQVGTAEICVADANNTLQPSYYGWTENYPNPVLPQDSNKYPVAIGDQMTATITFKGGGKFATVMTNKTQGWTLNTPMTFPTSYVPKSSEIITESSDNYPIVPKFDTITYPGSSYSPDGTQKLPLGSAPNLVKITNTTRTGLIRTDASPISGDTFNTPWTHN